MCSIKPSLISEWLSKRFFPSLLKYMMAVQPTIIDGRHARALTHFVIVNNFPRSQAGLSDVERQKMQHRIDVEIVEKRDQHLTVLKQKSIDRDDDMELESSIVVMDEHSPKPKSAKSVKDLKREDSTSDEEDADAIDDDINRQENFRKLGGDLVEIDLKLNDFGFGLALAGHSNRNRMGTFICGIHPQGAAFENGQLRVGDELLKIHKTVVRGRSHLNVSAIMKKVPNDLAIKVVALRHNSNMEKIAVKKFTQFPVKLDDVVNL